MKITHVSKACSKCKFYQMREVPRTGPMRVCINGSGQYSHEIVDFSVTKPDEWCEDWQSVASSRIPEEGIDRGREV